MYIVPENDTKKKKKKRSLQIFLWQMYQKFYCRNVFQKKKSVVDLQYNSEGNFILMYKIVQQYHAVTIVTLNIVGGAKFHKRMCYSKLTQPQFNNKYNRLTLNRHCSRLL